MSWLQLNINTIRENVEAIEDALLAAGAVTVTMQDNADQPILEPGVGETPLWNEVKVTGLFGAETDTTQATVIATADYGDTLPNYRWEILEDKDWERAWMDTFQPMQFGKRLWICPSWKEPSDPNAVNLLLDPGLAFGTGTHPTTALCLEWLDTANVEEKVIIDYGCGSGILGIAALLLGAKEVIAIDNDPQALIATLDNAERNHINPDRISVYLPEDAPNNIQADITMANILAGPLIELATTISNLTKIHGEIALSGILLHQSEAVNKHYEKYFSMQPAKTIDSWVRLNGTKLTT